MVLINCGQAKRSGQLFESSTPMSSAKKFFKGLRVRERGEGRGGGGGRETTVTLSSSLAQGVENVYTQHKPQLADTLAALIKGRMSTDQYPFAGEKSYTDR